MEIKQTSVRIGATLAVEALPIFKSGQVQTSFVMIAVQAAAAPALIWNKNRQIAILMSEVHDRKSSAINLRTALALTLKGLYWVDGSRPMLIQL